MKKVIALGIATCFAFAAVHAEQELGASAKTFLRFETPFQSASPERVSLFPTVEEYRSKHRANHNGDVQIVVFGGKNSSNDTAAAYYMPFGAETVTFNAAVDGNNNGTDTLQTYWVGAESINLGNGGVSGQGYNGVIPANLSGTSHINIGFSTAATAAPVTGSDFNINATAGADYSLAFFNPANTSIQLGTASVNTGATTASSQFVVGTGTAAAYASFNLNGLQGLVGDEGVVGNFNVDSNKGYIVNENGSVNALVRPWNFGIGYAPNVQMGSVVSESEFVSTIAPELERSHWGIGATYKQILSEKDTGFWLEVSTALQRVTMNMELHETVTTALDANPYGSAADNANWVTSWAVAPNTTDTGYGYPYGTVLNQPTTIAEAFAQEAWEFGRIDGAQSVTRLADIEVKLGYQFVCEDNVLSNGYIGIVIPTGNKAQAKYLAEPIVGNGFHFGLMAGSTAEIQLNDGDNTRWTMRSDSCFRYLFKNQQMRSFDTLSNGPWSRYMMVWADYTAEQANGELQTIDNALRGYTPGINVFTQQVNVTPQAQMRLNQALILESGAFKGEIGWNFLARQNEVVSLVNAWQNDTYAFVDASQNGQSLYNITRTIYNDSYQSVPASNQNANGSQALYNAATISATDLNLGSAASWIAFTNTPYLSLGYAFNEERSSVFSIGGSYEFSANNAYINDWTLWGKFSFSF